jgi:predicted PurR-regulated permease PerM
MDGRGKRDFGLEEGGFLALVLIVTLAFAWLLVPFFGAVLWGVVVAILFAPVNRWMVRKLNGHRNSAAGLTLLIILLLVILPAFLIAGSLVQEAATIYAQLRSGHIDLAQMFNQLRGALPAWTLPMLDRWGLTDFDAARDMVGTSLSAGLNSIAAQALLFGQGALSFLAALSVMLYLTYFLLRDGQELDGKIRNAVPLRRDLRDTLIGHFVVVVRATIKGTVVVAIIQGLLGGVILWLLGVEGALLWGVVMGFFSLVPAVGTAIVWVPIAGYLLLTGSIWEGAILVGCGVFVIGMVDNILRPILVGGDTRMPDFVILIATLAGLDLFGLNGFIIGPVIAALFIAVWKSVSETHGSAQSGLVTVTGEPLVAHAEVTASADPDTTAP